MCVHVGDIYKCKKKKQHEGSAIVCVFRTRPNSTERQQRREEPGFHGEINIQAAVRVHSQSRLMWNERLCNLKWKRTLARLPKHRMMAVGIMLRRDW